MVVMIPVAAVTRRMVADIDVSLGIDSQSGESRSAALKV
jgi:hypothetical protein